MRTLRNSVLGLCGFLILINVRTLIEGDNLTTDGVASISIAIVIAVIAITMGTEELVMKGFFKLLKKGSPNLTRTTYRNLKNCIGPAAKKGDVFTVAFLLRHLPYEIDELMDAWKTAVKRGDTATMRQLLDRMPKLISCRVFEGVGGTAIFYAAANEFPVLVFWLIARGAGKSIATEHRKIIIDLLPKECQEALGVFFASQDETLSAGETSGSTEKGRF